MSGEFQKDVIKEIEEKKKPVTIVIPERAMEEKFSIRLSRETRRGLEVLAKKYKLSMAEVMRQLVDQGLQSVNRQK